MWLTYFSVIALACLVFSQALAQTEMPLIDIEPDTMSSGHVVSLPGVFQLDEQSDTVEPLCIPSNGVWFQPGLLPCPTVGQSDQPAPAMRYQMKLVQAPGIAWVVANFGTNNEQWARAQALAGDNNVPQTNILKTIGQAASLQKANHAVIWSFDSSALPNELKKEIPGSGIFLHVQDVLPQHPETRPLTKGWELEVSTKLMLNYYRKMSDAACNVTIGIGLQAPDATGHFWPLPLLVTLFNSRGSYSEHINSDGRSTYAASSLSGLTKFVTPVTDQPLIVGQSMQVLTFRITKQNLQSLILAFNIYRSNAHLLPLNTDPTLVRLHQVDLRNEFRHLDSGNLKFVMRISYIKAISVEVGD